MQLTATAPPSRGYRRTIPTDAIARHLATLDNDAPIAVGVSGGSDSLALLLLLHRLTGADRLRAITVDHRIRQAAAQEARFVENICRNLGISHKIAQWRPARRGRVDRSDAATARSARHRLLAKSARSFGAEHIFLGHTRDDQAETFLIRCQDGSDWFGLAGMSAIAPSPVWPDGTGITLHRPLLQETRDSLQGFLAARGQPWVVDPSNEDISSPRIKFRNAMIDHQSIGARVLTAQSTFIELKAALLQSAKALAQASFKFNDFGSVLIHRQQFIAGSRAARHLALKCLIPSVSGQEPLARTDAVQALDAALGADGPVERRTVGNVWLIAAGDQARLLPDPGSLGRTRAGQLAPDPRAIAVADCQWIIDGRFRVRTDFGSRDAQLYVNRLSDHRDADQLKPLLAMPFELRTTTPVVKYGMSDWSAPGFIEAPVYRFESLVEDRFFRLLNQQISAFTAPMSDL